MTPHQAPVEHWVQPVFQSLARPILIAGVPADLFIWSMVGAMVLFLVWWPVAVLQGGVYLLARWLTAWEPQWFGILLRHLTYQRHYHA